MSLSITAKNIKFLQDESEHNYVVTVNPAHKSLKISIEGNYEIAQMGLQSHAFAQELILEPDKNVSPPRIVKMIRIRKKQGANMGKITHQLGNDAQVLYVNLLAEGNLPIVTAKVAEKKAEPVLPKIEPMLPKIAEKKAEPVLPKVEPILPKVAEKKVEPLLPKIEPVLPKMEEKKVEPVLAKIEPVLPKMEEKKVEPVLPKIEPVLPKIEDKKTEPVLEKKPPITIPTVKTNRKELFFPKIEEGVMKSEVLELHTADLDKVQIQVAAPFRLSLDNRTYSQVLNLQTNSAGDTKQIYVQVLALKAGTYTAQLNFKHADKVLHSVFVKAICAKTAGIPTKTAQKPSKLPWAAIAALLLVLGLGYWIWNGKKDTPTAATSATVLSTSNLALPVDPSCKPSLYQKLKEKTGAIRYTCVDRNCDTAFVREIMTFATGSKAFKYVSVHAAETPNDCGEWVDNLFKNNEIDIIFTDKPCTTGNMDMSNSVCEDKKCVFMIPCGNSEGFLKVLNKEIKRRKSEKSKAALRIVRGEWGGNS